MKKFLAVLLSMILAASFCVPAFAEDTSAPAEATTESIIDQIKDALSNFDIATIISDIMSSISGGSGEVTLPDISLPDITLPEGSEMTPEQIKELIDEALEKDPEMASTIINALSKLEYDQIQKTLDEMKTGGYISDEAYKTLSDEVKVQESVAASVSESIANSGETTTSPIDGVKDFFGNIINGIMGLFGGGDSSDDGNTTTTKKSTSGSNNTSIPKTGDIALYSVAGVALVAGLALVLTKKKNDNK